MEAPKEEIRKAVIELFERKGGYRRVAEETRMNTQTLYNLTAGRNAPTLDVLLTLASHYPDFVIPGLPVASPEAEQPKPTSRPDLPPPPAIDLARVLHDLERERREKEELQKRYNNLSDRHEKLVDVFLKEKAGVELSFLGTSSRTPTAINSATQIGFVQKNTPSRYRPGVRTSRARTTANYPAGLRL